MDNNLNDEINNAESQAEKDVVPSEEQVCEVTSEAIEETVEEVNDAISEKVAAADETIGIADNTFQEISGEPAETTTETVAESAADAGFFETVPVQAESVIPSYIPQNTQPTVQPYKKEKTGKGFFIGSLICLLLCVTALAFTLFFGTNGQSVKNDDNKKDNGQQEQTDDKPNDNPGGYKIPDSDTPDYKPVTDESGRYDAPTLISKVSSSVLLVSTEKGFGTGFVFTEDGYIITNEHVISGYKKATVTFIDGTEYEAKVVGSDSSLDIAVLKIDATGLQALELGDSDKVVAGEDVIAIGNPYDKSLANTASEGIVSAIRKNYHFEDLQTIADVIQHTASINSGNSGGPLFNMYGQVIGINAVKISGYENLGFAIAINSVKSAIEEIINNGAVQRPTLGITCQTNPSVGGVTVVVVNEGSAAEKAGLKVNDIITKFDGTRVKTTEELINILGTYSVGDVVEITILRDVDPVTLTLTLDKPFENTTEEDN